KKDVFGNQQVFVARSAPRFFTADPDFEWLNRLQCIAFGGIDVIAKTVHFDVFSVAPSEFRLSLRNRSPLTPDRLFAYCIDPDKLRQILPIESGTLTAFNVDVREGASFQIGVATSVDVHTYTGTFKEIVAQKKIVFTWKSNYSVDTTVTVEFQAKAEKDGTDLTLTQFPFASRESRDRYLQLWNTGLKNLPGF